MSQLSEKELSVLNDLLTEEDLLIKKFQMLAEHTEDQEISAKFTEISQKHQGHFNSLYAQNAQYPPRPSFRLRSVPHIRRSQSTASLIHGKRWL